MNGPSLAHQACVGCCKPSCYPCECETDPPPPCPECGLRPCVCPKEPCPKCHQRPCVCTKKAKVKLADGKERTIQHIMATKFWHPDGTPMSAQQFMVLPFGKLPECFKNETELRILWSEPDTRAKLLQGLAEQSIGGDQLAEMQKLIGAEKSDLFDVLAYVAYALPIKSREERADHARAAVRNHFGSKQQAFIDFVLAQYVRVGVQVPDKEKLAPLLKLKYNNAIADAIVDLGKPEEIGRLFAGFQKYLYVSAA